jgi:hypothetical protein
MLTRKMCTLTVTVRLGSATALPVLATTDWLVRSAPPSSAVGVSSDLVDGALSVASVAGSRSEKVRLPRSSVSSVSSGRVSGFGWVGAELRCHEPAPATAALTLPRRDSPAIARSKERSNRQRCPRIEYVWPRCVRGPATSSGRWVDMTRAVFWHRFLPSMEVSARGSGGRVSNSRLGRAMQSAGSCSLGPRALDAGLLWLHAPRWTRDPPGLAD